MRIGVRYILLGSICLAQIALMTLSTGCANRGIGPQGGPKDSLPPVITKMTVPNGARNVTQKEMSIQFNEFILLDGSTDNILISPPQQRPPEIKAVGKRIDIAFQEDLRDSTTYTIDFGDQIVDNNEKNPLKDFALSFSTGDQIDSLEVYGQLINAEDLNPLSGVIVGLHENTEDSAFMTLPFTRIGRTNEEGEFSIKNVKAGSYRLYALQDQSRDYLFQPGEGIAFQDELVTPYITISTETDTIYLPDTLDVDGRPIADSVITAEYYYYEPSNLLLRFFKENYQRHYFQRALRKEAHAITFYFGAPQDELPTFDGLPQGILQANQGKDTLTYWLTDSADIKNDTLRFTMTYLKSDSLYQLQPQTDTLQTVYRAPKLTERALKAMQQKREKTGLAIQSNASSKVHHFDTLYISSPTPLAEVLADSIHLQLKKDSTFTPVAIQVQTDSNQMKVRLITSLRANQDYRIVVDSAAMTDVYGFANKANHFDLHVRSTEEYATMTILLQPYIDNAYIQLLDSKDMPITTVKAEQEGTLFKYLEPGTYFMRMFIDEDGDSKWTTGDWKTHRQPEQVAYFPKKMTLRANWTFEETFRWQERPLLEQKPAAIRKDLNKQK
ncbi:MAG: Ig-like domain-containing protein [Paludibacteraceae bacterium]|nr:Ig-like domain-containing protein [Paludibacteraceae bacterium]